MLAVESSLVVLVPEAESVVKSLREKYDPAAAYGMPAHVTLLYPFKYPDEITGDDLDRLTRCLALFSAFHFSLNFTRRFPRTLYFVPQPDEPFRQLTQAICDCYPEIPPYRGKFPTVVPHLTVADQRTDEELDRITVELNSASEGKLPISAFVSEIALLDTKAGHWKVRATLKLA